MSSASTDRSRAWPQRGLFIGCIVVGVVNLIALDFVFAPMLFEPQAEAKAGDASTGRTK